MIKVAVVQRVCHHYRAPIFARINSREKVRLKVFHSKGIPGTKLVNTNNYEGFEHQMLFTVTSSIKSSHRTSPVVFCPTLGFRLMQYNPDVILVEGGSNIFNNVLVYAYAGLFHKPVLWWTLGELRGRKFSGLGRLYRCVVRYMEKRATALLGYSSVALNYFKRMGYAEEKCFLALNCVDTERVFTEIERVKQTVPELRTNLRLDNKVVILFVGTLIRAKSIDCLIYAFGRMKDTFADAHLLIVGNGPDRDRLAAITCELGIAERVTFSGEVIDDVAAYYQLGDVFVMPGLGGLAVSEAMAHGLPVICGSADGCEVDLAKNGQTGFLLEDGTENGLIEDLSRKLEILLRDTDRRKRMAENAKKVILNRHNIKTLVDSIMAAIQYAYERRHPQSVA